MASTLSSSTQPAAAPKINLTPVLTLAGQEHRIQSISYFPDGKQMISGSNDKTTRRWDLHAGKEIEGAQDVCEWDVSAVAVSKDGRWVVTAGGDEECGELKACEVQTEMVKRFQGHSQMVTCVDVSADSTLLASGSEDKTTRTWSMDTGKLKAGPFKSDDSVGAIRFSRDSKKLAINSHVGSCLAVWDVQTQKLDRRVGKSRDGMSTYAPVFWTNKETILAAFTFGEVVDEFGNASATTIYEFNASTLETLGAPFQGHTMAIFGLALSFDDALLVSTSYDDSIKLWAFESRQLLASFHVMRPNIVTISPDSNQLAYTTTGIAGSGDNNIIICNIPPGILSSIGLAQEASTTTPEKVERAGIYRRFFDGPETTYPPRRAANADPQQTQPEDTRLRRFLQKLLSFRRLTPSNDPQVDEVAAGRKFARYAAANLPEYKKVNDTRRLPKAQQQPAVSRDTAGNDPSVKSSDNDSLPDVHWCKAFLCYRSCWSHSKLRMPPRWILERDDEYGQNGTTSGSRGGAHGSS